jgi:glyoxylase-like metal-dependent hydrolase (beta-lactamase superfamily II)
MISSIQRGTPPLANVHQPSRYSRTEFLAQAAATVLGSFVTTGLAVGGEDAATASSFRQRKGREDSKVKRWDVITIGNLSRNRYWGENDSKGVRSAICTCVLVQGDGFRLIVDPSLKNADEFAKELDRRSGLKFQDVDSVFISHEHGDHWYGLTHFSDASWLAGPDVAVALNKTGKLPKPVEPATGRRSNAIDILPTPGHTMSHHSLRFDCDGLSVVIAGDAVATRDFWRERRGYFNCVDFELSARTMNQLSSVADIIVPGHDNYFLNPDPPS